MPGRRPGAPPGDRPRADGGSGADRVVRVLPDVAAVRRQFDYAVPPKLAADVHVGTLVRVVLNGRRVGGWVVDVDVEPPSGVELRPLAGVRGWGPPPAVVDLAGWAAWRWAGAPANLLATAAPATAVRSLPPAARPASPVGAPAAGAHPGLVAEALAAAGPTDGGAGRPAVVRLGPADDPVPFALEAATRLMAGRRPGEGARRAGVLVLAPGQARIPALADAFARAGLAVAVLPHGWPAARAGGGVVIGTRAAAWAPLPALAGAVVLDAHDQGYHQEQAPTWSAWAVVAERARRDGAPCLLVSPCPTLELLEAGPLVTAPRRAERRSWPPVDVVDRRADDPRTGLFSLRLVDLVRSAAGAGATPEGAPRRRVVCVLNRTGRVRLLRCAACGELARCERCQGPLELVRTGDDASLACRRCGLERPVVCAACGSVRLKALRPGVSRVREELEALAGAPVAEITAGTGGGRDAGNDPAGADARDAESDPAGSGGRDVGNDPAGAAVVVGTEAALHRLAWADAVAFLDFDAELLAPRLRAGEEALALLARAARLVSGGAPSAPDRAPGRLLVQTRQPHHEVLRAAVLADPGRLAASELAIRRELALPPVSALALVSGPSAERYVADLRAAAAGTTHAAPTVTVTGPVDGTWTVRADGHDTLCDLLARVPRPGGRLRVEVDPLRL